MTKKWKDNILESSTTTGTGDFTVAGAVAGHQSFASVLSVGDTFSGYISAVDSDGIPTGQWETGTYTYSAANTITRTTVRDGSNGTSAVNFSAGTKYVFLSDTANDWDNIGVEISEKQDLSAVSTITLEAFAGKGYRKIVIEIEGAHSVDGANLDGTFKLNGGYKTSNYRRAMGFRSSSGATTTDAQTNAAAFLISGTGATWGVGNAAGEGVSATVTIRNPDNTSRQKKANVSGEYTAPSGQVVGLIDASMAYDGTDYASALAGVKFTTSSGTFTGQATVYGYR